MASLLVVDDTLENRVLIDSMLLGSAYTCELVESGRLAIERLRQNRYDLVLMDLQMPGLDGLSATRLIRAEEVAQERPRVAIVAVTAHALNEHIEAARAAGCDDHLAKPFLREELVRMIQKHTPSTIEPPQVDPRLVGLLPQFVAGRRRDVALIREALASHDHEAVTTTAHTLKGIGASYGFRWISQCGRDLETAARVGDPQRMRELVEALDVYVDSILVR